MRRGRGYAPPFAGRLLGANGSGRRIMLGGGVRRRGRGIFDTIKTYGKKLYDFVKGNKDIQDFGKQGLSYLGGKAKDVIDAKSKSLVRKYNKENAVSKAQKSIIANAKKPLIRPSPVLPPAVAKRRAEVVARKNLNSDPVEEPRFRAARGIRRKRRTGGVVLSKTKRIGGMIRKKFKSVMRGRGIPMVPLAFQ